MDSTRFNGFIRRDLNDALFGDLWGHYIFNESDLHSAAYFYIRKYFMKMERGHCYVRCEPNLMGKKPDIVVYNQGNPEYLIEFKMFREQEAFNDAAMMSDILKIGSIAEDVQSIKWGFFILVYDCDETHTMTDSRLRRAGIPKVSFSAINMRRQEENDRKRHGYDSWRKEFDRLIQKHRTHA